MSKRIPSHMNHQFSQVPKADIPRSSFNRTHGYKTTFNSGFLIPVYCDEALPGDTFNMKLTGFGRLATPLFPLMDNMFLSSFFFAVPYRLIWDNWERFNGEQDNPTSSTDFLTPRISSPTGGFAYQSLFDYFGLPTSLPAGNTVNVNAFHSRAYNLIWNEWFRDENLQDSAIVDKGDGPDLLANYFLRKRGKRHDYFTSALPWPQKGPAVSLPLGSTAPVITNNLTPTISGAGKTNQNMIAPATGFQYIGTAGGNYASTGNLTWGNQTGLTADLSAATSATINALRQAFQIQKIYERDARGGTRYTEIIRAHFGVISPDARLQRPEYLGGGSSPVIINPIAQTSSTDAESPLGNLAAMGTVSLSEHGFTKSFTEHCVLIGMVCVHADLTYQQGINKMWNRRTRWDYYWPALAHIGEQAITRREIYAQGSPDDALIFGYQERYAEYRYKPSLITGQFRSSFPETLDGWHLAQNFSTPPVLNDAFIQENPPVRRILAVTDPNYPEFIFDSIMELKSARPMPVYGVPGLIDHF